jgi:hypothetical protein
MIEIVMYLNVKKDTQKVALITETLEDVNLHHTVDTTMKNKMILNKTVRKSSKLRRKFK